MPQRQIRNAESKWFFFNFPVCFKNHIIIKKIETNHNKVCMHNGG